MKWDNDWTTYLVDVKQKVKQAGNVYSMWVTQMWNKHFGYLISFQSLKGEQTQSVFHMC